MSPCVCACVRCACMYVVLVSNTRRRGPNNDDDQAQNSQVLSSIIQCTDPTAAVEKLNQHHLAPAHRHHVIETVLGPLDCDGDTISAIQASWQRKTRGLKSRIVKGVLLGHLLSGVYGRQLLWCNTEHGRGCVYIPSTGDMSHIPLGHIPCVLHVRVSLMFACDSVNLLQARCWRVSRPSSRPSALLATK